MKPEQRIKRGQGGGNDTLPPEGNIKGETRGYEGRVMWLSGEEPSRQRPQDGSTCDQCGSCEVRQEPIMMTSSQR